MRVELKSFLNQHEIVHPTRLIAVDIAPRQIRLGIAGHPWWRDSQQSGTEDRIYFEFQEIDFGQLDLSILGDLNVAQADETLEDFSVVSNEPGDWTDKTEVSILCQSPLPDPSGLYAKVHSYLQQEETGVGPRDILNCPPGKLSRFAELTSGSHYLVARAPRKIAAFIGSELTEQKVTHYELAGEDHFSPRLIVRWQGSVFTCEKAFAEFD